MFRGQRRPDPAHHNYNRAQSPKGRFAARLSWMQFQLKATAGNLSSAYNQLLEQYRVCPPLTLEANQRMQEAIAEIRTLAMRAKALAEEIAELNSPDKWAK